MMTTMDRSARAVQVLSKSDPQFADFVQTLYGPGIAVDTLWEDAYGVSKLAPDPSDVATSNGGQSSTKRKLAFAGTVAGGLLAGKEVAREAPKLGRAIRNGKGVLVPAGESIKGKAPLDAARTMSGSPAGRTAVGGTALLADGLAGDELNPFKKDPNQTTSKRAPKIHELAAGREKVNRALIPTDHPALKAVMGNSKKTKQKVQKDWRDVINNVKNQVTQPPGKHAVNGQPGPMPNATNPSGTVNQLDSSGKPVNQVPGQTPNQTPNQVPNPKPDPATGATQGTLDLGQLKAVPTDAKSATTGAKAGDIARDLTSGVKGLAGTTAGKVGIAAGAGYAGLKILDRNKNNNAQSAPYDPYALYKADEAPVVEFAGTFSKLDEDKRLAFGYASVVKIGGQPVIDRQGDLIEMEDIEKAAYDYVQRSRRGGGMHKRDDQDQAVHVSDLVESFVITDEKVEKMGLPQDTPRGWWVGYKVHDDDAWEKVRKGEWTGFSIHGKGKRVEKSLDEAMGY